jgi:transcriptional regulator with XRE-family HTH domain
MGELAPLSQDIPEEARELADQLRRFFKSLNISVRRYAARCNYDPATVSRYLNGKRVPPWSFIQELVTQVAEHRGSPIQREALDVIRSLHRAALQKSSAQLYKVQILQDQLAEADKEQKRAGLREKVLLEAMEVRQRRIAQLEIDTLELNSSLLEEKERVANLHAQLEIPNSSNEELDRLKEEVRELKEQLTRAQELSEQAEARCEELERQLREAEEVARSGQEAREQELLESALQEVAEARASADRFKDELERLKNSQPETVHDRRKPPPQKPSPGRILADSATQRSPASVAAELARMSLSNPLEAYHAEEVITRTCPIGTIGQIILEVNKLSGEVSRTLLMMTGQKRTAEDVFELIRDFGSHTIDRSANVGSDSVTWFTWNRDWQDIELLMHLLKGAQMGELATLGFIEAAKNQEPLVIAKTLREIPGNKREKFLGHLAVGRRDDKLLELLAVLQDTNIDLFSEVSAALEREAPERFEAISTKLNVLGML